MTIPTVPATIAASANATDNPMFAPCEIGVNRGIPADNPPQAIPAYPIARATRAWRTSESTR
jgi:hypothetical protein